MKKLILRILLLVSLSFGCLSSGFSQNLVVSGITNPTAANGIYEPNGTLFGYDSWKHATQNFYIYNDDYVGRYWNIDDDTDDESSGVLFYSTSISTAASPVDVVSWDTYGTTTTPSPTGTPLIAEQSLNPEMDIQGNSISILDGDSSPSAADHTDFGSLNVSSGSVSRTFTIENSGTANLLLTDASPYVSISGHTLDFTLTSIPSSTITSGGTTTFEITFNPTTIETRTAVISIANNDSDENPYNFTIQGEGYAEPSVTTNSASSITGSGATLNGNINANYATTTVTFEYGLTDSYGTLVTADESPVSGTSDISVSREITGLTPNTTYHYRAVGNNSAGTAYGADETFTTAPLPATITTQAVTEIAVTTATGNGNITDLGAPNPTQHGVCWSTSENPTTADDHTEEGAVGAVGAFTSGITGLAANTSYFVRAYATNTAGTSYGTQVSFTTDPLPATITTQAVTEIAVTTATGNGNITDLGAPNPTQHGVCWSTSENPTTAGDHTEEGAVGATGAFTSGITALAANTSYFVRAYATNTAGTSYGAQVSFTTDPAPATVTTQAVTEIAVTTATGNGNITDLGVPNPTQHGVCWSTSENPTTADDHTEEGAVGATGAFTSGITGLAANTGYFVRAYATNTAGTSYGTQVSFTTDPAPATVTTQAVTEIAVTTATGNGSITDLGVPNLTQHGVCWSTSENPTTADDHTEEGAVGATGAFTSGITGLAANTGYFVRAYATNTAGTSYGAQVSFTTDPAPATVTTQAVTEIAVTTATGNGNITDLGVPNPTQHGVCWSTSENPTTADDHTEEGAVGATGAFTSSLTSLLSNTLYYVRAYAINTGGTSYGAQVNFTTLAEAPVVTTNAVTEMNATSATLVGTVNANNTSTTVTFEYGLTDSYGTTITADESPVSGTSDTPVSSEITGLSPNTTYHYRVVGVNDGGTTYGDDLSFTTTSQASEVTTNSATEIETTSAILNGTVNANDLSTTVTFEYGLTTDYDNSVVADQSPVTGTTDTDVSAQISGLKPNTVYFYRLVGQNSEAVTNGNGQTFTTARYDQEITFSALSDKTTADADFDPGAISSLGLEISYSSSNELVATIVNGQIHIVGAGTADITASQEGNDTVDAATPVSQNLTVNALTGTEQTQLSKLEVYPIPTRNTLFIDIGILSKLDNVSVEIIDLTGKVVVDKKFDDSKFSLDVSSLATGLYFVKVKSSDFTWGMKIIKE